MRQRLKKASARLCAQCPVYDLDKALVKGLYPMMRRQPDPLGQLFQDYHEIILDHHYKQCLATYERGLRLAKNSSKGVFPLPAGGEISQDYFLVFVRRPRQMRQAQAALKAAANDIQKATLDFYFTILADMLDLEHMFSSQLGCQNGLPDPRYEAWVQKSIRPDERSGLSWWSTSL